MSNLNNALDNAAAAARNFATNVTNAFTGKDQADKAPAAGAAPAVKMQRDGLALGGQGGAGCTPALASLPNGTKQPGADAFVRTGAKDTTGKTGGVADVKSLLGKTRESSVLEDLTDKVTGGSVALPLSVVSGVVRAPGPAGQKV